MTVRNTRRPRRTGLLLGVLIVGTWQASSAQTPLDLAAVLAIALENNPDLVTARLRLDSAYAEQRIARALPNPTASGIANVPYQYAVTEPIDLGPQRIFRTRAAGQGASATQFDVQDVARQVRFAVRQAYFDLLLAQAQRDVAGDQRDIFRQLLVADSERVRTGDVPERNLTTSEVQLARVRLMRGDNAAAEELGAATAHRLLELDKATSALEASLVQADAMIREGRLEEALTTISTAERAASTEAASALPRICLQRSRALLRPVGLAR